MGKRKRQQVFHTRELQAVTIIRRIVMTKQDRPPNFREEGKLFLVRCFVCNKEIGKENLSTAVAKGYCAWCGWSEDEPYRYEQD